MEILKRLQLEVDQGHAVVMVTVVAKHGEGPMPVGGRMLVSAEGGLKWGTVGGGAIERRAIETATAMLGTDSGQRTALVHYDLTGSGAARLGVESVPMICGGEVSLYYEVFRPEPAALIFGGGNVGSALYQKLYGTGFRRWVCDPAAAPDVAPEDQIVDAEAALAVLAAAKGQAYVIIATGEHTVDASILKDVLQSGSELAYLGMLASKKKMAAIRKDLEEQGIAMLPRIYSPIGLDIGAVSPDEIAIAIAAQLIARRRGIDIVADMDA